MSAKDKLAYFKDNIAGADEDEFDASQYYYNRSGGPEENMPGAPSELGNGGNGGGGGGFAAMGGGIFGNGEGGLPGPNSQQQRSTSVASMAAPGLSGPLGMDQYSLSNNGLGRSTSAPSSSYVNQDQTQQQTPGDLFALLNKGGSSGVAPGGGASLVPSGGNSVGSGLSNAPSGAGIGSGMGSAEVAGLSMIPGSGGVDALSVGGAAHPDPASFDISEFPALGGAPGTGRSGAMMNGGNGNFGAYPDSSQHSSEFTSMMSEESFPALPGGNQEVGGIGLGGLVSGTGGPTSSSSSSSSSLSSSSSTTPGASNDGSPEAKQAQYGLLGLLAVIRMMDADLNTLALGSDLTTLGLNLNSAKSLYTTFASPWADGPSNSDPQFTLPACYYMTTPPPLKHAHLHKFQLETLFYIFYAMPKDLLQAYAGQELYHRDWRYHIELKLWFRRATQQDLPHLPAERAATQYIFFDINSWECRLFNGNTHIVSAGLMSEDEVRVRLPST